VIIVKHPFYKTEILEFKKQLSSNQHEKYLFMHLIFKTFEEKSKVMRSLFGILLLITVLDPPLSAQDSKKGFEINFSLVHPAKWSLSEYKFSTDPTLEVLYFTSVSKKLWVAGGIFAQAGKHNWLELYGHTFIDDFGMPYRLRTDYNRQLEFFSLGIPVKFGMNFNNSFSTRCFWDLLPVTI
jgi:hypothetical protein